MDASIVLDVSSFCVSFNFACVSIVCALPACQLPPLVVVGDGVSVTARAVACSLIADFCFHVLCTPIFTVPCVHAGCHSKDDYLREKTTAAVNGRLLYRMPACRYS